MTVYEEYFKYKVQDRTIEMFDNVWEYGIPISLCTIPVSERSLRICERSVSRLGKELKFVPIKLISYKMCLDADRISNEYYARVERDHDLNSN